jgi:hypothetical protein
MERLYELGKQKNITVKNPNITGMASFTMKEEWY